jgi:hypothetical protein
MTDPTRQGEPYEGSIGFRAVACQRGCSFALRKAPDAQRDIEPVMLVCPYDGTYVQLI